MSKLHSLYQKTTHGIQIPINEEWFKRRIVKSDKTDCWYWRGSRSRKGYGLLTIQRKSERAHRLAFKFFNGPIPNGSHVLHKCDNPPCCNPAHLFLGDNSANAIDRESKGRGYKVFGERHHRAKLTDSCAEVVRGSKFTGKFLAAVFGISKSTVYAIKSGRIRHIDQANETRAILAKT